MSVTRRAFALGLAALPLSAGACGKPKTPLAHLHGQGWVHGAYEHYGKGYHELQASAEQASLEAYSVLAQKGIVSLDALQSREVPFHLRIEDRDAGFQVERDVPSVLTFRAEMSAADRAAATAAWEKAREHIQTDYVEIRRLEWALTRLLQQLQRARGAIDTTRDEQFRLVLQASEVSRGELPFELPYEVTPDDYNLVLALLVERLENDRARLLRLETEILAVGLAARATDAGSASLSANLRQVLLAIVEEEATEPRAITFPSSAAERDELVAKGRELSSAIERSPEYAVWREKQDEVAIERLGGILAMLDQATGLPTSSVYQTAVGLWRGSDDYLGHLRTLSRLASVVPGGKNVAAVLERAVGLTETVRDGLEAGKTPADLVKRGLVNTGTKYAKDKVGRQLVFFEDAVESTRVAAALEETDVMTAALPAGMDAAVRGRR